MTRLLQNSGNANIHPVQLLPRKPRGRVAWLRHPEFQSSLLEYQLKVSHMCLKS